MSARKPASRLARLISKVRDSPDLPETGARSRALKMCFADEAVPILRKGVFRGSQNGTRGVEELPELLFVDVGIARKPGPKCVRQRLFGDAQHDLGRE